ncbi:MAG: glycoside hydrolase family 25 protein [Lachnospiraceae bacterium]|nr:glycoside hydrolase family 25 protein [Lachnospiraceae bacterium]
MSPERRKKKKGAGVGSFVAILFLSTVAFLALIFCVFLLIRIDGMQNDEEELRESVNKLNEIEEEGYITEADALRLIEEERAKTEKETTGKIVDWVRNQLLEGNSTKWMLRNMYRTFSNELIVESSGGYFFFPVREDYKPALVDASELQPDEDGIIQYRGADAQIDGSFGIDVSRFQGKIDWEKVAADGVKSAFIRVGFRGSSEGKLSEDPQFVSNIEGALANGIDVGVYFYTQAINEEEAVEEADFVIEALEPYEIRLPVVFDFESADSDEARTNHLTQEQNTDHVLAFCERISAAGYQPMVYGNLKSFLLLLDMDRLEHLKKWFAFYDTKQYFPYEYSYWQYFDKGQVDGIQGDVDLNICIEDLGR